MSGVISTVEIADQVSPRSRWLIFIPFIWIVGSLTVWVVFTSDCGWLWPVSPLLVTVLGPLLVYFPEFSVGLLQGSLGLVPFMLSALNVVIPDGWMLPLFSGASLAGMLYWLVRARSRRQVFLNPLSVLIFMMGLLVLFGVSYSWSPKALLKAATFLATSGVSFCVGAMLSRSQRYRLYIVILITAAVFAAGLLWEFTSRHGGTVVVRYTLADVNPIWVGRIIGMGIVIAPFLVQSRVRQAILMIFLGSGLLLTGSRGPLVSLAFAVLAVSIFGVGRCRNNWMINRGMVFVGFSLCIAFLVLILVGSSVANQNQFSEIWGPTRVILIDPKDINIVERFDLWNVALKDFMERPLWGWGTAGYGGSRLPMVQALKDWPHNIALELLSEYGIVGFTLFGLIVLVAMKTLYNVLHRNRMGDPEIVRENLLVMGLLIYGLVNASFSAPFDRNPTIWLALGLILGVRLDGGRSRKATSTFVNRKLLPCSKGKTLGGCAIG